MKKSRREFIKKSGCALGMVGLATQMEHFGLMSALAQKVQDQSAAPEGDAAYKALVVIFWSGGNDGNNMVIPNHSDVTISNHAVYAAARSNLALTQAQLAGTSITVPRMGGLSYALHPALGQLTQNGTTIVNNGIHDLWAQNKMAIVTNCGTLVRPLTKAQYQSSSFQKPYQLFSHSDQVTQAQTSISNTQSFTGWGGRISDRMTVPGGLIPMVTSISGAQLFTSGQTTLPLAIGDSNTPLASVLNPAGFTNTGGPARLTAFNALRTMDLESNHIDAASNVTDSAMSANAALQNTLDTSVLFPNTSIGRQLRQVARLIKERNDLNVTRQIFYCQIGGFDTHNNQLTGQTNLFTQYSQAVRSFYDEMGMQGVQDSVTTFTLSDFGRTFNPAAAGSASVGSDHAWGNHMFVIGGSVLGGNFYGMNTAVNGTPYPQLTLGGLDDSDSNTAPRGRWIPTTSVDQYAATLARWYGLPDAQQAEVFPNIGNFNGNTNLGFLP